MFESLPVWSHRLGKKNVLTVADPPSYLVRALYDVSDVATGDAAFFETRLRWVMPYTLDSSSMHRGFFSSREWQTAAHQQKYNVTKALRELLQWRVNWGEQSV